MSPIDNSSSSGVPTPSESTPPASSATPSPSAASASGSLPPISADEQAKKTAFDAYGAGLAAWLASQNVNTSDYPNPMVGTWTVDGSTGYFQFTDTTFAWYEDGSDLTDNYYQGTYSYMPGAQTNAGYVLNQGAGNDCYSIFQHYTATRTDGADQPTNYYGVFIVQRQGSSDSLYVVNQRTGGDMTLTRAS